MLILGLQRMVVAAYITGIATQAVPVHSSNSPAGSNTIMRTPPALNSWYSSGVKNPDKETPFEETMIDVGTVNARL